MFVINNTEVTDGSKWIGDLLTNPRYKLGQNTIKLEFTDPSVHTVFIPTPI